MTPRSEIPAAALSPKPAVGYCAEVRGSRLASALFSILFGGTVALATWQPAEAHDIYTGIHGKNGFLCCGGNDCAATTYRESGGDFQFLTRENEWVTIPQERITFLPIPGDAPSDDSHHAHLCYRPAMDTDDPASTFGTRSPIHLYCAFIPPTYF
ncbi:MAG: hypothetical protein P4L76_17940 [Beijerinckiaceae bacterium]|nr:hypothetical protein [Beijerinckiaceae bacterium]